MEVLYGTASDIDAWMKLVERVAPQFPGLETKESQEEYKETALKFMGVDYPNQKFVLSPNK